jgi:hypothetical protein
MAKLLARLRDLGQKISSDAARKERSSARFPVQLPLKVKYGPAMSREAEGETRDLSVGGVFFITPDAIPAGAEIELLLPVPPPLAHSGKMWMFCTARVVRAEPAPEGHTGVGAIIDGYKILADA